MSDVYWHTRKRLWSRRCGGKVQSHHRQWILLDVTFVVKLSAVERIRARRQREVCAWVTGTDLHPRDLRHGVIVREVRFDPYLRDDFFYVEDGASVTKCQGVVFGQDGRAWAWTPR